MFTQDLTVAYMVEAQRSKEELAAATERCRVCQLLSERRGKLNLHVPVVFINVLVLAATLLRKH
jgi:hypothetical protein